MCVTLMLARGGCPYLAGRSSSRGSRRLGRLATLCTRSLCIYEVMEEIVVTPMSKEDAEKVRGARPSFERCATAQHYTTLHDTARHSPER